MTKTTITEETQQIKRRIKETRVVMDDYGATLIALNASDDQVREFQLWRRLNERMFVSLEASCDAIEAANQA